MSVQLRTSRLSIINFVIEQTAHIPAVSTSVPALEISLVRVPAAGVNCPPHLI